MRAREAGERGRASSLINRGECGGGGGEKSVGKNGPDCVSVCWSECKTLSLQEGVECYRLSVWDGSRRRSQIPDVQRSDRGSEEEGAAAVAERRRIG